MFERLGAFVSRHWGPVVVAWLLLAGLLHGVAPRWNDVTHDGDLAYMPGRMPSIQGERLLAQAFPSQRAKSQMAIIVERPGSPLSLADQLWSDSLADLFRNQESELRIIDVWNRNSEIVGEKLTSRISKFGQATVTLLHLKNEFMAVDNMTLLNKVQQTVDDARRTAPPGLNVGISGSGAVGGDMLRAAAESIKNTELTTVALVFIILLVVYRAPLLVSIPLITIGISLFVSLDILALLTQLSRVPGFSWWNFKVFTTTKIFIVVILFGAGTDFCLFLISRYREEMERGLDRVQAATEAVARIGGALVASAMTTICGLGMMFFADFGKFRNSGPAIALCLAVSLAACLTLAPALLRACGRGVFWPLGVRVGSDASDEAVDTSVMGRFWEWTATAIVNRPGLILLASVLILAPLAYEGRSIRLTYDFLNELQPTSPSVLGAELAKRHFSPGELAPVTILAFNEQGHFDAPEGTREIARLTKILYDIPGVESVRSIAEPLGDRPGFFQPFRARGLQKLAALKHKQTRATYLTQVPNLIGKVARFDLVLHDDAFSPAALQLLNRIEVQLNESSRDPQSAWHNAQFRFVGTTVGIRDLEQLTQSDQRLIERLVVLAVLAVLITLLRRPLVCAYLIVSVLFSYFVTIGATQLFFGWLYGVTYVGLDWKVPLFLFVILIAIGEDYNIYLVTRVIEEQRRYGAIEGLRRAVAKTGGIITSCGVIMAGTFVSMMTGTLRGILELGFALSLGVMLDTCIVRPILVPAFLALLERGRHRAPRSGIPAEKQSQTTEIEHGSHPRG